jgi:hypothetical protein
LQRARETHPDKGGSADTFRCVVRAFETLTGETQAEEAPIAEEQRPKQRFSLDEISELAAQVRALNRERKEAEQKAFNGRQEEREQRRRRSDISALHSRKREEENRLKRALRNQQRLTMPSGVKLCNSQQAGDWFCAVLDAEGMSYQGPERRTISAAETDLEKLQRAGRRNGADGVERMAKILQRAHAPAAWH